MKDELTSKMHSEFTVSPEIELEHRVWASERQMQGATDEKEKAKILASYNITADDFARYKGSWDDPD